MERKQHLNNIHPIYKSTGNTKIWYYKKNFMRKNPFIFADVQDFNEVIDKYNLESTHDFVIQINDISKERIFKNMQSTIYSPNGEAVNFIILNNISHTSMSLGDIIQIDDKVWICDMLGWTEIE